ETTDDVEFTAVTQRRTKSFHISRISPNVTEQKIKDYLINKNISVTLLRILNTKNPYMKTAKVNVQIKDAKKLLDGDFWPHGIRCRHWLSNTRYQDEYGYNYQQNE
ncbi:unnamed protein product, partial [Owenia fusiformis]